MARRASLFAAIESRLKLWQFQARFQRIKLGFQPIDHAALDGLYIGSRIEHHVFPFDGLLEELTDVNLPIHRSFAKYLMGFFLIRPHGSHAREVNIPRM